MWFGGRRFGGGKGRIFFKMKGMNHQVTFRDIRK